MPTPLLELSSLRIPWDYLLQEEPTAPNASGNFSLLLTTIETAAQLIADQLRVARFVDLLGHTGRVNTFGEEVQKLDAYANQLLVDSLLTSGTVHAVVSEELEQPVFAPPSQAGEYLVYLDPIDGSSNIWNWPRKTDSPKLEIRSSVTHWPVQKPPDSHTVTSSVNGWGC